MALQKQELPMNADAYAHWRQWTVDSGVSFFSTICAN